MSTTDNKTKLAAPEEFNKLVVAISSRALFDLVESHQVFTTQGVDAYHEYQIANEDKALAPGIAFNMVKKLLALNNRDLV